MNPDWPRKDRWMDGWTQTDRQMDGLLNGQMDEKTDRWMDR